MILEKKIPQVSNISYEAFHRDFVVPQIPVVITGVVDNWPALNKWTPEYLDKKIGSVNIGIKKSLTFKHPDITQADPGATMQIGFSDYLQKTIFSQDLEDRVKYFATGDENFFYKNGKINETLNSLVDDFSLPGLFPSDALEQTSFWISVKGLFTWLHYDGNCCNNLNVQVEGSKKAFLINPNEIDKLYPVTIRETVYAINFSKVDMTNYDEVAFPEFKDVPYQETILEKGQMLYIPVTWYHAVQHLGDVNMNVNFWWKPEVIKLNPAMRRAEMLKIYSDAYLLREMVKHSAPSWDNWCKENSTIANFIFQCDEYLASGK